MSGWKIAALVDGKFDGEEYGFDFKEGGFFDDKDISQKLVMKQKVCVLKKKNAATPGFKTMSKRDVFDNLDACKDVMDGW